VSSADSIASQRAGPGEVYTSRVAGSLLTAAGLTELIAGNLDEYEEIAIEFAEWPQAMRQLRDKLMDARETSPLFDTTRLARNLETAIEEMWQRHQLGQSPAAIVVEDVQRPSDS
jgi:protein O-GlcNAc transferase